jgi:hypothetical protein
VAGLPTLAHKILHLLSRDGARTEASFVRLAEVEEVPVPEKAVREAVGALGEAGKIRKRRSTKTGRVYLAPLERMAERELETLLIGVMADRATASVRRARSSPQVEGFRRQQASAASAPPRLGRLRSNRLGVARRDARGARPAAGLAPYFCARLYARTVQAKAVPTPRCAGPQSRSRGQSRARAPHLRPATKNQRGRRPTDEGAGLTPQASARARAGTVR